MNRRQESPTNAPLYLGTTFDLSLNGSFPGKTPAQAELGPTAAGKLIQAKRCASALSCPLRPAENHAKQTSATVLLPGWRDWRRRRLDQ
jgi:hypothetical protein